MRVTPRTVINIGLVLYCVAAIIAVWILAGSPRGTGEPGAPQWVPPEIDRMVVESQIAQYCATPRPADAEWRGLCTD